MPDKHKLIDLVYLRYNILSEIWTLDVACPYQVLQASDNEDAHYLKMVHVSSKHNGIQEQLLDGKETEVPNFDDPVKVLTKAGQGFVELPQYFDSAKQTGKVEAQALVHLMARYILDPIVEDSTLSNILVVDDDDNGPVVYAVDYEEYRRCSEDTIEEERELGVDVALTGASPVRLEYLKRLFADEVLASEVCKDFLTTVDQKWVEVESLIIMAGFDKLCSVDKMKQRAAYVKAKVADAESGDDDQTIDKEAEAEAEAEQSDERKAKRPRGDASYHDRSQKKRKR